LTTASLSRSLPVSAWMSLIQSHSFLLVIDCSLISQDHLSPHWMQCDDVEAGFTSGLGLDGGSGEDSGLDR
jgi:hypothetical protein